MCFVKIFNSQIESRTSNIFLQKKSILTYSNSKIQLFGIASNYELRQLSVLGNENTLPNLLVDGF